MILASAYITQSLHFILVALKLMVLYFLKDHLCLAYRIESGAGDFRVLQVGAHCLFFPNPILQVSFYCQASAGSGSKLLGNVGGQLRSEAMLLLLLNEDFM
ncbi:hypothetical protein AVEN_60117-1 [Araneus ventricosus]|uniref:Uncharacterized protein n=1 Tax=Araneus ventricosus TaxID=182803 RepID=A0A4Y2GJK9_ARAVE|nr:hypothetical protein AVEN_60117-1 [Araneus ventricosus]